MRTPAFGLVFLLSLLGCGGGGADCCGPPPDPDPTPTPTPGVVAAVAIVQGEDQRGEVGKELSQAVVVRATDARSLAIPQQLMNWVVVEGGGSLFVSSTQTNDAGESRNRWTLGPGAVEQAIESRAVDPTTGEARVFARITATADPGPPAQLTLSKSEHQMFIGDRLDLAGLATIVDQYGNAVTGAPVRVAAVTPFDVDGTTVGSKAEGQGQVTIESGVASAALTLTVLRNLGDLVGGTGGYACVGSRDAVTGDDESVPRLQSDFVVDSVVYTNIQSGAASLWVTQTVVLTAEDHSTRTVQGKDNIPVGLQRPGQFFLSSGTGPGNHSEDWATQTSDAPLTYVGQSYCQSQRNYETYEPFTITKQ